MPLPRVRGFGASGLLSDLAVQQLLERVPSKHLNGISDVRYVDRVRSSGPNNVFGVAIFRNGGARIVIYRQTPEGNVDMDEFQETIYHEVGHCVHQLQLDDSQRHTWIGVWERASLHYNPAGENLNEHFADCYVQYVVHPRVCEEATPEEFAFIKEHLFDGMVRGEQP